MKRHIALLMKLLSPDIVQVSEMIDGESIHHQEVRRNVDVVTELEQRYMFFARQADVARNHVMHGQSCAFNVYFREP